jgi:4-aminobutyrate aminotransferase/(S)-3-amino-2-methylpropionate transaminase
MIKTEFRTIVTEIPHPDALKMVERLAAVESQSMHGQLPVVWDRAEGSSVWDPWGNRWIDFTSTIFVANAGHGHPQIVDAIVETVQKPLLHAYNYPTSERLDYIEELIRVTPSYLEKAFLVSAGTEAVEVAIKLMRMSAMAIGKRRSVVVSFEGNWHGRTTGAQHLSSNLDQRSWIGYEDPGVLRLPFPYPWMPEAMSDPKLFFSESLQRELDARGWTLEDDIAGFMLETYQGWGAVFYPADFVKEVERVARESRALLVFDEMQSGFARTGEMFGYQHYGVQPDLVCCGKGASSSVPLAFVLGSGHLLDLPSVGSMSSTHSANPISCAAGLANLKVIENEGLIKRARDLGHQFHSELNSISDASPAVSSIQGLGMVAAIITNGVGDSDASAIATEISWECMRRGLLVVHTGRESVKVAPPLTIDPAAMAEGLSALRQVIDDVTACHI